MPRIEIYDLNNTGCRIDSFDWPSIRRWLGEWARILNAQEKTGIPLRMSVLPLFHRGGNESDAPDWNADTRYFDWFEIPWEPDAIMARIEQQRKAIERAKADGVRLAG